MTIKWVSESCAFRQLQWQNVMNQTNDSAIKSCERILMKFLGGVGCVPKNFIKIRSQLLSYPANRQTNRSKKIVWSSVRQMWLLTPEV